ncbi:hypothetical protein FRC06_000526, partial [Ceratobasidium sp. 370]
VIEVPSGLLDSVSEYCMGTLASYLEDHEYRPQRIDLMIDTLRGLTHMHGLSIVHGDLKSVNVLVTDRGTAKLCDFGHSQYIDGCHQDQLESSDTSSRFQATMRYMCPEFFRDTKAKPTIFSDMWAFGCLALEILSQLQPYHHIENEFLVPAAIRNGAIPSVKPEYPNAAGCLNDVLWSAVKKCWYTDPSFRPSSNSLLNSIFDLLARGLINPSAATPERPILLMDDEIIPLRPETKDFADRSSKMRKESISAQKSVNIWAYFDDGDKPATGRPGLPQYVAKVPCITARQGSSRSANRSFENGAAVNGRARIETSAISDSSNTQRAGISAHNDIANNSWRFDAMGGDGNLKLTSISFARLSLDLPPRDRRMLFNDDTASARYLSPELVQDEARPTPASDMWAFGNVAFWIFSSLIPYPEYKDEIQVISQLTKGNPPNGLAQFERLNELGGRRLVGEPHWLTNGIWASILRCWNIDAAQRPTATQLLREIESRPDTSESSGSSLWTIAGVADLTGRIKRAEKKGYGVGLGWSIGIWRSSYDGRGKRKTQITLLSWKTELSQGFFRSSLEVTLKSAESSIRTTTMYAARDYYTRQFHELRDQDKNDLVKDLGNAIHYLHHEISQGVIVHGNLSMETILIDAQGTLKLSNFEFSCQYAHADNALEATAIFAPSLAPVPSRWHAPEFFEAPTDSGWPNPTQFTDLWSLGCVTVAISTNEPPYAAYDSPGALSQIISGASPYLQEDCTPEIWEIASQLWASPAYERISTTRFIKLAYELDERL